MGVTGFSFIVLPLCLLWLMQPTRLLQLMLIVSVFEAAAAFTIGDLGVQPGLVPALAFMGFTALQLLLGVRYPGDAQALRLAWPMILVTIWAVVSSYVMPRMFGGIVYVWPQKMMPPIVLTALAPSSSNLNQDIYLVLDCFILVLVSMYVTKTSVSPMALMKFYFLSGFGAAAVAVWQFGNRVFGLPYPDDLFYSNPGWAILTGQAMGSMPRINGSFSEPSALASYMVSIVAATGWVMLRGNATPIVRPLFIVGLLTIALSTSATGFTVLAVLAAGVTVFGVLSGSARIMLSVARFGVPAVILVGLGALGGNALGPEFTKDVQLIVDGTVNKQDSASYKDRTSTDVDSLQVAVDTDGLGAGWGSNRSSSLIPGLLAGIGVPGVLGLAWFGTRLALRVRQARRSGCTAEEMIVIDGCCGAVVGLLLAALLSAPTLTSVTFFFLLALLIGSVSRIEIGLKPPGPAAAG